MSETPKTRIIQVQLVTDNSRKVNLPDLEQRRWLWIVLGFFAIFITLITTWFWIVLLLPRVVVSADCSKVSPGLMAFVSYPAYIANGDVGDLQITLVNNKIIDSNIPISSYLISGKMVIDFEDPSFISFNPETPNVFSYKELSPGEQLTSTIYFFVNRKPQIFDSVTPPLHFGIREATNKDFCILNEEVKIKIINPYRLRDLVMFLMKFGVGAFLLAFTGAFWDGIKKFLLQ